MPAEKAVKQDLGAFLPLVASYRIVLRPGVEIIHGRLRSDVDPTDPGVQECLTAGGRTAHLSSVGGGVDLLLVRAEETPFNPWLHLGLFLATVVSVLAAGALLSGVDPMGTRAVEVFGFVFPWPTGLDLRELASGWTFALPFLGILAVHEGGHLWAARRHRVAVTPPYFIPMPPYLSIIGTLGAFIRLRGPMVRRNVLMDVGAWGPIAGFVVAVPVFLWGLTQSLSGFGPVDAATPYAIRFAGQVIYLGASPFTLAATHLLGTTPEMGPVLLHPVALAGWLGLFVTALNLIPIGQLDGGHVLYALGSGVQRTAGRFALLLLAGLGFVWWGWWFWGAVVLVVGRGRVHHPPLFQEEVPLSRSRRVLAVVSILIFFLCFAPVPISL